MAAQETAYLMFLPVAEEHRDDPYALYRTLPPVFRSELVQAWVLTKHADVVAVLSDRTFSADRTKSERFQGLVPDDFPRSLLGLDPPDHTRLRTLVTKAFTPRMVEHLRGRIEVLVGQLLDTMEGRNEADFIEDFAYPLPVNVIAEMLGVPASDWELFRGWSKILAASLDPLLPMSQYDEAVTARKGLVDYLKVIVAARRSKPTDDLISGLIAAEERGDMFNDTELLTMLVLLLVAGHETTVNLLGNGLVALMRNRDQWDRLSAHPELAERAVEEMLRYDSPVQLTSRVATEPRQFGGETINEQQTVITLTGAANRDPDAFADPDRLDLGRQPNPHVAFGRGIHFCLGAPLARLEGQIAFNMLARRFPGIELAGPPVWKPTVVLRGPAKLSVRLPATRD